MIVDHPVLVVPRSIACTIAILPRVRPTDTAPSMLLPNGLRQGLPAQAGIELGLHKGSEVLPGSSRSNHPHLFIKDSPGVLSRKPIAADPVQNPSYIDVGHPGVPCFRRDDGKLHGIEN